MTPATPSTPPRPARRVRRRAPGPDGGPRPLADSLDDALAGLAPPRRRPAIGAGGATPAGRAGSAPGAPGRPPAARALGAVFARWEEITGPALARHVRPVKLTGGVLVVAVDHPAWATQVRALGTAILDRVGEVAGEAPEQLRVTVRATGDGR